jgi:hypothetical protein
MSSDVLLLNRNFYAIQITSWERALSLVYSERALVVDEEYRTYDFENWLELSKTIAEHPAGFVHTPTVKIAIPEVIALRLFEKVPKCEVTFTPCNLRKGNRLPAEAHMRLRVNPTRPKWHHATALSLRAPFPIRRSWQKFVDLAYWDSKLED